MKTKSFIIPLPHEVEVVYVPVRVEDSLPKVKGSYFIIDEYGNRDVATFEKIGYSRHDKPKFYSGKGNAVIWLNKTSVTELKSSDEVVEALKEAKECLKHYVKYNNIPMEDTTEVITKLSSAIEKLENNNRK